jgi:hypothetical protein
VSQMSTETVNTRDRLLAGAISLIEEGGEAAVRVESVANLAGVTRPSLYITSSATGMVWSSPPKASVIASPFSTKWSTAPN